MGLIDLTHWGIWAVLIAVVMAAFAAGYVEGLVIAGASVTGFALGTSIAPDGGQREEEVEISP